MGRAVPPYEMYRLKSRMGPIATDVRWKVTARFEIQMSATKRVKCVRLHCYATSVGFTLHFSEAEFDRLFKRIPK
jgi:hypothetical protein